MWIIDNSLQLKAKLEDCNQTMIAKSINTWDFSTLYTTIPHQLLKDNMSELIDFAYKTNNKAFIAVNYQRAFWTNQDIKRHKCVSAMDLRSYIDYMVDHIYVTLGSTLHRQVVGIPMGISCAPLLVNLLHPIYNHSSSVA